MFRRKSKKYITCTFPVKKKSQEIDKNGEEITKNISNTLTIYWEHNIFNNLSEGTHRIKCKYGHDDKKCETCGIKYKYCEDDLIEYKCFLVTKIINTSLTKS